MKLKIFSILGISFSFFVGYLLFTDGNSSNELIPEIYTETSGVLAESLGEQTSTISNRLKKTTINLGVGDPEFRVPKKEIVNLVKKIENKKISYTNPSGIINLKKKSVKNIIILIYHLKTLLLHLVEKQEFFFHF